MGPEGSAGFGYGVLPCLNLKLIGILYDKWITHVELFYFFICSKSMFLKPSLDTQSVFLYLLGVLKHSEDWHLKISD